MIKLFRPSSGPALELCSHFESIVTPSPNKIRGSNFHMTIAEILRAKKAGKEITPEMANGFTDQADWALQIQEERCPQMNGIEQEFPLYHDGEFLTSGTIDLYGFRKENGTPPQLVDWKTGQERDYWAQLSIYGLSLLEQSNYKGVPEIDLTLAFVDQQRAFTERFSRDELRKRVDAIIEAVRDPASGYYINAYCGYCDLRGECPAWTAERSLVGSFFDKNLTLAERFSVLKQDPEKLGRFIVAFRRLKNMVEKVEQLDSVALGMIQSGATMTGLTTIKRKGTETIDAGRLISLIDHLKPSELTEMLTVDLKVARELWAKNPPRDISDNPIPFPKTKVGEPTEYLALKK